MAKALLRITGPEALCLFACVSEQISGLNNDLKTGKLSKEEIQDTNESLELCNSLIDKIKTAYPKSNFYYEE